jgi:TonB-dependent receptor
MTSRRPSTVFFPQPRSTSPLSRIFLYLLLAAIALNLFCLQVATAQVSRGTVSGRLTDSGGGLLQGARVELQPSGVSTVSNTLGEFTIENVAPGTYEMKVNFVGFAPFSSQVAVAAGQTARADAVLQVASKSEEVVVTAQRVHGEAEEVNRTRTADNVLQVLTAEVITSLPNANIADAVGRLPSVTLERDEGEGKYVQVRGTEPRYTNVTIDGVNVPSPESDVRQIKLDVVASDLVEAVEINKTLQANMDGDGIGGSVNMRTKTAGEQPTVTLYGLGGYTPILADGRGATQFGGTIGQRFLPDKRLGVLFGGTYDLNGRGINDVEPAPTAIQCDPGNCGNPSANAPYVGTYNTEDIREYRYYRERFGFEGSADYRLNNGSSFYIRGLFSHFNNFGDRWVFTPTINSFTTSPFQGGLDGNMSMNIETRRPIEHIGSLTAGGHQVWPTWVLSWNVSASLSGTETRGYSTAAFGNNDPNAPINNVQFGVNLNDHYRPVIYPQNGVNIYDPSQYFLQSFDFENHSQSYQLNLQGGADLSKSYRWNGAYGTFAFGGKVRNAHKYNEPNDILYNANDQASIPVNMFPVSNTDPNYYDKTYSLGYMPDFNAFRTFFQGHPNLFSVDAANTFTRNAPNQWDIIERVSAGYLMNSLTFGKFRLYGGVRFEGTTEDNWGNLLQNGAISPIKKNASYFDALPSGEVRYAIKPDTGIRFAYSRGLARPNFQDLVPYLTLNVAGARNTSKIGNPNLVATHADNIDVLFEQYLKPLGLIQAGYFYKRIEDPIVQVQTDGATYPGIPQSFIQTQTVNAGSAHVQGFEAAFQQRLSYLPGVLSALGISANYGYSASQANGIPGRSDHPALVRQAPHTWNISPTYDRGRVSFRLGLSYNAANIFSYNYSDGAPLGLHGPNGDTYLYAHLQVDAQTSVRLVKGFTLVAYGLNLNNEVFGFYQGDPIWPIQREYYKPTIGGGFRWTSRGER